MVSSSDWGSPNMLLNALHGSAAVSSYHPGIVQDKIPPEAPKTARSCRREVDAVGVV